METLRLTSDTDRRFAPAWELYRQSFPPHEQRTPLSQRAALACPDYHYTLLFEQEGFAGLMLYWEAKDFLYLEHFCTQPGLRGRGYGHRALQWLCGLGKKVILEIDPLTTETARRRKGFYERCGFAQNPYPHIHPPYHEGTPGHELIVMSYPGVLCREEYEGFARYLAQRVMEGARRKD